MEESLHLPLREAWRYVPLQPPRPAWPDPLKEPHSLDFDWAPQPVIAGGRVYFASSADDTLRALNLADGSACWEFTAAGPIRFAPHVIGERCYVASDDGHITCLDAATGRPLWTFRAAPADDTILGNGRLISRWPVRSGVLVSDNTVYAAAGMWPAEGIYVYALDAQTGAVRWCNDTCGAMYIAQPHQTAYAMTGVTPQGYLSLADNVLIVPNGRSGPAAFDRRTGDLLYYREGGRYQGNWWHAIDVQEGSFTAGTRGGGYDLLTGSRTARVTNFVPNAAVRSGSLLIQGDDEFVAAVGANDEEIWRSPVKGRARGLAVADGALVVSTDTGAVYCFREHADLAGQGDVLPQGASLDPVIVPRARAPEELAEVLQRLNNKRVTKGYAIVLSKSDVRVAQALAEATQLHVIALLTSEAAARAERRRLLAETALYGSRVSISAVPPSGRLQLPPYIANAIVVSSVVGDPLLRDLYRALRPCGGVMALPGGLISRHKSRSALEKAGVPVEETRTSGGCVLVERGKLPGAFDWDSEVHSDQRVRWPLELLWFGGQGPALMPNRHWGPLTPRVANGRYFVIGEHHIIAVDAYNGVELWLREIPYAHGTYRREGKILHGVAADDDHLYINLGEVCYRLDAQTGEQEAVYGSFKESESFALNEPRQFEVTIDRQHRGTVSLERTETGLALRLKTEDPELTDYDAWELYFDFRPIDQRRNLYEPGVFQLAIQPGHARLRPYLFVRNAGTWRPGVGPVHPDVKLEGGACEGGTDITLRLEWDEIARVCKTTPETFGFGATLISADQNPEAPPRAHLFADGYAGIFNNGWATFVIDPGGTAAPSPDALTGVGKLDEVPRWALGWGRMPARGKEESELHTQGRVHPLFGNEGDKTYLRSYGCGGVISSATMDFFRSSTLGFYDYESDSGLRNFGGVRPGCGHPGTLIPALGLLVANEGSSGCSCSYNFQCSLALAPTEKHRNEDWSIFHDAGTETGGLLLRTALNLGAPGDRRDEEGTLWLGFPRPWGKQENRSVSMGIPFVVETEPGLGPYRFNSDRTQIEGTDRPWVYASGYRGIRRAVLDLAFNDPIKFARSHRVMQPPVIDGVLDDACWDRRSVVDIPDLNAVVRLRHGEDALYLAYRQELPMDRLGNRPALRGRTSGADAPVWDDHAMQLDLRSAGWPVALRLGVSASGARYDAAWRPVFDIPRLPAGVAIDGDFSDWGDHAFTLDMFDQGECRLAWNDKGLLCGVRLRKTFEVDKRETGLALFTVSDPGQRDFTSVWVDPAQGQVLLDPYRRREGAENQVVAATVSDENFFTVEALWPWDLIGVSGDEGAVLGFPMLAYRQGATLKASPGPHVLGLVLGDPASMFRLRLAETSSASMQATRNKMPGDYYKISPAVSEESAWGGPWRSAVTTNAYGFTVECALPWSMLEDEGFEREQIKVDFRHSGRLGSQVDRVRKYFVMQHHSVSLEDAQPEPRTYTVRLHFAEPDGIAAGKRIFDVKMQGQTVLPAFDITTAAGGPNRAVTREFRGIVAASTIELEFVSETNETTPHAVPILCGVEVEEERNQK